LNAPSALWPAAPDSPFSPDVAHPARVYNVWLGGKDHFAADRQAAQEVARCRPQVIPGARANRAFLARVVRYLTAERGVRQFLDIGPGLPAPGNTRTHFPAFHIWCETTLTGVRYIARSRHLSQNPHTLVTTDPAELRAVLTAATIPAQPTGRSIR